jgi:hypothetical protein
MTKPDRSSSICATCCAPVVLKLIDGKWMRLNKDGTKHECRPTEPAS